MYSAPNDNLSHALSLYAVCSVLCPVDTEEAALLHEEATMTIEELLVRYGQNKNASKQATASR